MPINEINEKINEPADVGFLPALQGGGGIASRLLANNMNIKALRNNDTLTYDAWKNIDTAVLKVYQERLEGVADLQGAGLTYSTNGLAETVLQYQDESDFSDAELNMDGVIRTDRDRPDYLTKYLPLPIISKDFSFTAREIAASRNRGVALDTTMAEACTRKVTEKAESVLFTGASSYAFGGGTIYGYQDQSNVNTGSLSAAWASATGAQCLTDSIAMKNALIADRKFGPYTMYVGTGIEGNLDQNFTTNYSTTIRQRILQIANIQNIKVIDKMNTAGVLLVSMQSDVVRMVEGLPITVVQWETQGGMMVHFKVMVILVPQIRADQAGRSGIAYWT